MVSHNFTDQDWDRIEGDWSAWWAGELERPMVMIEEHAPPPGADMPDLADWFRILPAHFALGAPASQVLDYYEIFLSARCYYGDAWPRWWPNFGAGIAAGFLGCDVYAEPDTVWFSPSEEVAAADMHLAYDAENEWWRWVKELTVAAIERWGDHVAVAHTDLGGNMDILASLRTTARHNRWPSSPKRCSSGSSEIDPPR